MVTSFKNTATRRTEIQPIVDICFVDGACFDYGVSNDMAGMSVQDWPQQDWPQQYLSR
jgi:hypothetical protein